MTKEQRCEYMREWRSKNREQIRERKQERARRAALDALETVKRLDVNVFIMRANDGREYVVGGRKR